MKVVIVNCFDTYEQRIDLLYEYFKSKGHDVSVIESDFRHFEKVKRIEKHKINYVFIKSKPYYKNISLSRLISHYNFAKNAFKLVEELKPDLLYVTIPPNSLAKFADKYKKKHSNVKLYFDIIDLWPETMPIGKIKTFPPFTSWRQLRDNNLKRAELLFTECNLYQSVLSNVIKGMKTETLYLASQENEIFNQPKLDIEKIHLCYLGSINNIIDITMITKIIKAINRIKPVVLHIVGDGENRDSLIEKIKVAGATVEYYGKVYDTKEKQKLFDKCHFGLNIMKDTVCVGLTMKSIDYFRAGLPILNSIIADTSQIVDEYKIGFNVTDSNIEKIANEIVNCDITKLLIMRKSTQKVFESLFSRDAFKRKLDSVLQELD